MKRKILLTFVVFGLPFIATSLFAEDDILGWEKAKWGMTQSQIAKLYDIGTWAKTFPTFPRCFLKKKKSIGGHDFNVSFWFDKRSSSGKLYAVRLEATEEIGYFDNILGVLVEKYGKPDYSEPLGSRVQKLWYKSSGKLKFEVDILSSCVSCMIEYTVPSTESDKL